MEKQSKSRAELRSKDDYRRDRSRSPRDFKDTSGEAASSSQRRREDRRRERRSTSSSSSSSEEYTESLNKSSKVPPPPIISKISMSLKTAAKPAGIKLKLSAPVVKSAVPPPKASVASAFNDDSDEEEEMPAECKMRMRNIGKATPTSSGPNSFGKTKLGFVDSKKIFEKKMQEMLKEMGDPV